MAATSAKSGLTVEINKCRKAISNLKSCQTVINETINDVRSNFFHCFCTVTIFVEYLERKMVTSSRHLNHGIG